MKRRKFIRNTSFGAAGLIGATALGSSGFRTFKSSVGRPNILFITTDYQAGEDNPVDSPFLHMPNMERLCREGVVFTRHYCTAPVCMPARYTFISGQYPHSHGAWDNTGAWVPEGTPIMMQQLAQSGYNTIGAGKMHFSPWNRMAGFKHRINAERKGNWKGDDNRIDDYAIFLAQHGLSRWSYLQKQTTSDIYGVYDWPFDEKFHIDHYVGQQTVRAIEKFGKNTPWFIWSSFNGPHNPWDPPARCSDRYKRMELPGARIREDELNDKPPDHTRVRYNYTRGVPDRIDHAAPEDRPDLIHRIRAGHFGGLSFIDEQIGFILDSLESSGQMENTIVIFSSDHGCELGDHHNIHKGLFYERSARVPMVIWSPSRYKPARIDSYSGHVDLFPTFLSLAGEKVSSSLGQKLEGDDLTPLLSGHTEMGNMQAFNEIRGGTNIVTGDWKMSIYPRDASGELYDRHADPDELYNLFEDDNYEDIRERLTERLVEFHPPLKQHIESMKPVVFIEKDVYKYRGGDHIQPQNAPFQAGKSVSVSANIDPASAPWIDGPVFASYVGGIHGYSLYIKDGHLVFGLRRWGRNTLIVSPEKLPLKSIQVGGGIGKDGELNLLIEGSVVSAGKVDGPLPVQEGHERIISPHIFVGHSPRWANPVGEYTVEQNLSAYIDSVELRLDNV